MRHRSTPILFICCALSLATFTSVAATAAITEADLAALGDADYNKRQTTMRRLLADDTLTAEQIAAIFPKAESVEQKHRLMSLARHHLLRVARERRFPVPANAVAHQHPGALGLKHAPVRSEDLPKLRQSAVRIRHTLAGFPAHSVLEVGDLVLAIQGNPIPANFTADQISRHFGEVIQFVAAGQQLTLTIHRDGKTMDVKVRLASYAALNTMYQNDLAVEYDRLWVRFRDEVLLKAK